MTNYWTQKQNERLVEAFRSHFGPPTPVTSNENPLGPLVADRNALRDRAWQIGPFVALGWLVNPWEMEITYIDDTKGTIRGIDVTRPDDPHAALAEARERWAKMREEI